MDRYKLWRKSEEKCSMHNRFSITVGRRPGDLLGEGEAVTGEKLFMQRKTLLELNNAPKYLREIFNASANILILCELVIIYRQQA